MRKKSYTLIPASKYCGVTPRELLKQVRVGFMSPPNGAYRWAHEDLEDWTIDHLRTPTPQLSTGGDGDMLSFAEVGSLCDLTFTEMRRRISAGTFPPPMGGSSFRQAEVEAWLLGLW